MRAKKLITQKKLKEENRCLTAKLKRALADYDNLEKRVISQREELVKFARVEILDKFISVLDDLERAEENLQDRGLTMAANQFRAVLKSEGVEEIEAAGKTFDPEKMDCVGMSHGKKNQVTKVVKKGYILKGKVIRPAEVEVGSGAAS